MNLLNPHKPIGQTYLVNTYKRINISLRIKPFLDQLTKEFNNLVDKRSAKIRFIAKNNQAFYSINNQDLVQIDCLPVNFVDTSKEFNFVEVYSFFLNYAEGNQKCTLKSVL